MKRKEFLKMTAGLAGGVAGLPLMRKLAGAAVPEPGLPGAAGAAKAGAAASRSGSTPSKLSSIKPPRPATKTISGSSSATSSSWTRLDLPELRRTGLLPAARPQEL